MKSLRLEYKLSGLYISHICLFFALNLTHVAKQHQDCVVLKILYSTRVEIEHEN